MSKTYSLTEEQKKQFAGIYLLEYMINAPKAFEVLLRDEEEDLESILEWLLVREYIEIKDNAQYIPIKKGREALENFMARYSDFLNVFDIFCAVDLGAGTFAFASYFEYTDKASWSNFLKASNWEDLRVAVADYKGIDPIEIVFMSYLNEGRFGRNQIGWQFDLLLGTVWDDILKICNTAIQVEQLGFEGDEGRVSGDVVIRDIISQGTDLLIQLKAHEAKLDQSIDHGNDAGSASFDVDPVDLPEYDSDYYEDYRDPDYRPNHWRGRWEL